MTRKVRRIVLSAIVVLVLLAPILGAIVCFIDSFNYPRIARSAYWRHPQLLIRAARHTLFPGKGVCAESILRHAEQFMEISNLDISLLYLPDSPSNDKTIKARVLCLIAKGYLPTEEELFWVVAPKRTGRCILDETVVYEYRTGRLICAEDYYTHLGGFALE